VGGRGVGAPGSLVDLVGLRGGLAVSFGFSDRFIDSLF
jgi:hypothetical protein